MAAPAFNNSANSSPTATTGQTVTLFATAANDILILVRVNGGGTALTTPGGTYGGGAWTTIDSGTWTTGAGEAMWSRCTGNHVNQTVTTATTNSGVTLVVRITGAITTGSPIDQASITGVTLGAVSGGALTGVSTTALDTLICYTGAVDDDQGRTAPTMGGAAMSNLLVPDSSGGTDSAVWYANSTQAAAGAMGNFAITNGAGTAEGKRVSAFAILSARHVILGAAGAVASPTLALTTGASTGIGRVQLGSLASPEAGTQTLSIRARASAGSGILRTTLYDSDGVTARGTADFTLTGSFQTFTLTPSAGIVDWTALQVAFEGRGSGLTAEVSWIELRVPQSSGAAPANVPLDPAAATSSATLALTAPATVVLETAAAQSTASLAATAKTTVSLQSAAAVSVPSLALTAATYVPLGTAAATSTATLALTATTVPTIALASAGQSTATLAVTAKTTVALGTSAATSSATLVTSAKTTVALNASAASSAATLSLAITYTVPLQTVTAASSASLSLTAGSRLSLSSAGQSTATLAVGRPIVLTLIAGGQSSTGLSSIGPPPSVESHPTLGGIYGYSRHDLGPSGTLFPGAATLPGMPGDLLTGTRSGTYDGLVANGVVIEGPSGAAIDSSVTGGAVVNHLVGARSRGSRGGIVREPALSGVFDESGVGAATRGDRSALPDQSLRDADIDEPRRGGEADRVAAGVVTEPNRNGEVY